MPCLRVLCASLTLLAAFAADDPVVFTLTGAKVDPTVLNPLTASSVPWEAGDRLLLVGDLLAAPNQPELAVRLNDALTAARPNLELQVRAVQGHGSTTEQWRVAALTEIARRPPTIVLICVGLGDVVAAQVPKTKMTTVDGYRKALTEIVVGARAAGATVVICTPPNFGDKPAEGPGFKDLEAFAEVARTIASETHFELCELRKPLLAKLADKNPKATRDVGILSKVPGQFRADGMDFIAGLMAQSLATAVSTIPWTAVIPGGPFKGSAQAEIRIKHATPDQFTTYYTIDGSEPTPKSPVYSKPFPVTTTTQVRALVQAKEGGSRKYLEGWYTEIRKHVADAVPGDTLPGVWVDHFSFKRWREPMPDYDGMKPDFETWWPNCDLDVVSKILVHRYPEVNFGLRFTGYFSAPVDGVYQFTVACDDSCKLNFGDLAVFKDDLHAQRLNKGSVELSKGLHAFTLLYGQGDKQASLSIEVVVPGMRPQQLSDMMLRRTAVKPVRKAGTAAAEPAGEDADPAKTDKP
jgi:hypothetical protein